jgi:hypothetical protein
MSARRSQDFRHQRSVRETGEWMITRKGEWKNRLSRIAPVWIVRTVRITFLTERVLEYRTKSGDINILDKRVPWPSSENKNK